MGIFGSKKSKKKKTDDPYAQQKKKSKEMAKAVRTGKMKSTDYYQYYYNIPYRLRKEYGVPKKAPRFRI